MVSTTPEDANAFATTAAWHDPTDVQVRKIMMARLRSHPALAQHHPILQTREDTSPSPSLLQRLEWMLYHSAGSLGEYLHQPSLERRVQGLVTHYKRKRNDTDPSEAVMASIRASAAKRLRPRLTITEDEVRNCSVGARGCVLNSNLDLLHQVCSFLDGKDVLRCRAVNKFLYLHAPSFVRSLHIDAALALPATETRNRGDGAASGLCTLLHECKNLVSLTISNQDNQNHLKAGVVFPRALTASTHMASLATASFGHQLVREVANALEEGACPPMTDHVDVEAAAPTAPVNVLLGKPTLLARVVAFVGSVDTRVLVCLNRNWAREMMKPAVWEISAGVPYEPLLLNCFRRAANYCYREVDAPSPNVNRRGSPPAIRACLLNERTSMREYVRDLKLMTAENEWFDKPPRTLNLDNVPELKNEVHKNPRSAFENLGLLNNRFSRSQDARLVSGAIDQERANFYLWSLEKQHLRASMTQTNASCYDVCDEALAVGCTDGAVKIWSFSSLESRNLDMTSLVNASPTTSISHRSSLGMVPFIRTRAKDKVVNVRIDHGDGTFLHLATSTEKGEANVWDVTKGEIIVSIPSSKIHKSMLPRSQRETSPQITSLMLLRNTLVCGTSCGLIRVFDLRSSRLTHRLAGHPGAVVNADTKGRVLWSAGNEGTVRWWGGKSAKILSKSALCEGTISALEMDETVVVAGYSEQGMEAWDVRTQQSLCTFSNHEHGGVKALQFDNRKLVSVSSTGKAALWRWYEPNPVRWFEPPTPSERFISTKFNDRHLVFGTDCGGLVDYDRLATVL